MKNFAFTFFKNINVKQKKKQTNLSVKSKVKPTSHKTKSKKIKFLKTKWAISKKRKFWKVLSVLVSGIPRGMVWNNGCSGCVGLRLASAAVKKDARRQSAAERRGQAEIWARFGKCVGACCVERCRCPRSVWCGVWHASAGWHAGRRRDVRFDDVGTRCCWLLGVAADAPPLSRIHQPSRPPVPSPVGSTCRSAHLGLARPK